MSGAYYNENDAYPAQWLRNLSAAGHIAKGQVDDRSIKDVTAADLSGYSQCHFFAGIGVWSYALKLAGWPADEPVWTGSCPCQPFSNAGTRAGAADERHLWPAWFALIRECRPQCIFGEQVASSDGRLWLDAVSSDLESLGYTVGSADLCAAGVGAPHIRQRLFFVAYAAGQGLNREQLLLQRGRSHQDKSEATRGGKAGQLGDAHQQGPQGPLPQGGSVAGSGFWSAAEWLPCTDGKARPVEPGTFPMAPRSPNHVGGLCAYGNAIVAPLAAEFIRACIPFTH